MKRGFDYFSAEGRPIFVWFYWIIFALFYLRGFWIAMDLQFHPLPFLVLAFIPFPIIWSYRVLRHPYYQLEERLKSIAPDLYDRFRNNISKHPQAEKYLSSLGLMRGFLYGQLMTCSQPVSDVRIQRYIKNTRALYNAGQYSLVIWFLTTMMLFFVSVAISIHKG